MLDKEYLVVLSTCPTPAVATEPAQALVEEGHAACVNVLPAVRSIAPEVVALRVADGHHPYLDWLADPDGRGRPDES